MVAKIDGIKIDGIAAAVSNKWDSLMECSDESPEVIEKFIRTTSVKGRWSASSRQTTSDFCYAAAEKLIEVKKLDKEKKVLSYL